MLVATVQLPILPYTRTFASHTGAKLQKQASTMRTSTTDIMVPCFIGSFSPQKLGEIWGSLHIDNMINLMALAGFKLSRSSRLLAIIVISFSFFVAEIVVGFSTHSLALIADSFHYLSDLIGFVVALVALKMSERQNTPDSLSFGWQRLQLLGAFFNGVFLMALGLSIFLQSIERFIAIQHVKTPRLVLVMGCVGLTLNIVSVLFLHEHHDQESPAQTDDESPVKSLSESSVEVPAMHLHLNHHHHKVTAALKPHGHDLGMAGVLLHLLSDAINNIGIIVASIIICFAHSPGRFYADPSISMGISLMIFMSSYPLVRNSGRILLQTMPVGVDVNEVTQDLESIPGVVTVHDLHVWQLSQYKSIATAHVVTSEGTVEGWTRVARVVGECLCAYGVHSVTLQPEMIMGRGKRGASDKTEALKLNRRCRIHCGEICRGLRCCG
ncbi:MAG: hypothetical protein Q9222_000467 [Ikaeria aurantiellina]